jgi:hypothetical protein
MKPGEISLINYHATEQILTKNTGFYQLENGRLSLFSVIF